jgi:hypothetical protein
MAGIAEIQQATITPTKSELANKWLGSYRELGSYRFVDPQNEVGIEVLVGYDLDDRLVQLPVSYRSEELDPAHTLATMEHSVLGTRYVSNALGDPVAVREFIRTIVEADTGAQRSDGKPAALEVQGSGISDEVTLGEVVLQEVTRQRAVGEVEIDFQPHRFVLRVPHLLVPVGNPGTGHQVSRLRITGKKDERELLVAELSWLDG